MKKFLLLVILLTLVSCKTIIQREVEFVFPVVPELEILHVPELDDVFTEEIIVKDGKNFYLISEESMKTDIRNEKILRATIIAYENQIKAYNKYKKMYGELMREFGKKQDKQKEKEDE